MANEHATAVNERCSVARSLSVVGERWSLLIVREALWGRTRFSELRDALGVAPDILSARLRTLVDAGVLERRPYRDEGARERWSYHLTPAGEELRIVLAALLQWGDAHRPSGYGPARVLEHDGAPVHVGFVAADGVEVAPGEVAERVGPGAPE